MHVHFTLEPTIVVGCSHSAFNRDKLSHVLAEIIQTFFINQWSNKEELYQAVVVLSGHIVYYIHVSIQQRMGKQPYRGTIYAYIDR